MCERDKLGVDANARQLQEYQIRHVHLLAYKLSRPRLELKIPNFIISNQKNN